MVSLPYKQSANNYITARAFTDALSRRFDMHCGRTNEGGEMNLTLS